MVTTTSLDSIAIKTRVNYFQRHGVVYSILCVVIHLLIPSKKWLRSKLKNEIKQQEICEMMLLLVLAFRICIQWLHVATNYTLFRKLNTDCLE